MEKDCFLNCCPCGDTHYCGSDCCTWGHFYPLQRGTGAVPAAVALAQRGWSSYLAQGSGRPGSSLPRPRCWRCGSRSAARPCPRAARSAWWGTHSSTPALGSLPAGTPAKGKTDPSGNAVASAACRECCCRAKKINLHKATVKIKALSF